MNTVSSDSKMNKVGVPRLKCPKCPHD